jgi:hypothetical protein
MDFIVQLNGPTSVRGSVLDQLDGSYTAHYTVTRAGDYELIVNNVQRGGLTVEYYENIWLFHRPVLRGFEPGVDHSWGLHSVTKGAANYVSARWRGYLRASYTETLTFHVEADNAVRLRIDDTSLIDCWGSVKIAVPRCASGASISVTAGHLYSIRLDYRHLEGPAHVRLLWASQSINQQEAVPASCLFYAAPTAKAFAVSVVAAETAARQSEAFGRALTLATAGQEAVFHVRARDAFGNARCPRNNNESCPPLLLAVRVAVDGAQEAIGRVWEMQETGEHGVGVTTTSAASQPPRSPICGPLQSDVLGSQLYIELLHAAGVAATYYAGGGLDSPLWATSNTALNLGNTDTSLVNSNSTPLEPLQLFQTAGFRVPHVLSPDTATAALSRYNDTYSVRWRGYVMSQEAGGYSFAVEVRQVRRDGALEAFPNGSGVRMWVNGKLLVDQWTAGMTQST